MIYALCTASLKNHKNKIYGYTIQDFWGQSQDISPKNLKQAIISRQVNIVNVTLASNGRIIINKDIQSFDGQFFGGLGDGNDYFSVCCYDRGINYKQAIKYKKEHPELSDEQIFEYFRQRFIRKCEEAGLPHDWLVHACNCRMSPSWREVSDEEIIRRTLDDIKYLKRGRQQERLKRQQQKIQ